MADGRHPDVIWTMTSTNWQLQVACTAVCGVWHQGRNAACRILAAKDPMRFQHTCCRHIHHRRPGWDLRHLARQWYTVFDDAMAQSILKHPIVDWSEITSLYGVIGAIGAERHVVCGLYLLSSVGIADRYCHVQHTGMVRSVLSGA